MSNRPHIHRVVGLPQSGKSTMALGMLERLQREGIDGLCIVENADFAQERRRRTSVPVVHAWQVIVDRIPPTVRAVVLDDFDRFRIDQASKVLEIVETCLGAHTGPTQVILVETGVTR